MTPTRDPGPPTWSEAATGAQLERDKAGDMLRRAKEALSRLMPGDDAVRETTRGLVAKADSDWRHFNGYAAKALAFIRVHPAMADGSIYAKCPHDGACFVGADRGWYAAPGGTAERSRIPGEDDGDE